jgi:hypothetical protein
MRSPWSVCEGVGTLFQPLNNLTDFHETWYERFSGVLGCDAALHTRNRNSN